MIVNEQNKSMDIESRDINYLLSAYLRMYLFQTRNVDPEKIIFPMFRSVPHPFKKGMQIPVEYVPDDSPVALTIKEEGSNVPETTPLSEATADAKEKEYQHMKKRIAELEAEVTSTLLGEHPAEVIEVHNDSAKDKDTAISGVDEAHQPSPSRLAKIKVAGNPAPTGSPTDYGSKRDPADARRIAQDLLPEKEINEEDEKPGNDIVDRVKGDKQSKEG